MSVALELWVGDTGGSSGVFERQGRTLKTRSSSPVLLPNLTFIYRRRKKSQNGVRPLKSHLCRAESKQFCFVLSTGNTQNNSINKIDIDVLSYTKGIQRPAAHVEATKKLMWVLCNKNSCTDSPQTWIWVPAAHLDSTEEPFSPLGHLRSSGAPLRNKTSRYVCRGIYYKELVLAVWTVRSPKISTGSEPVTSRADSGSSRPGLFDIPAWTLAHKEGESSPIQLFILGRLWMMDLGEGNLLYWFRHSSHPEQTPEARSEYSAKYQDILWPNQMDSEELPS